MNRSAYQRAACLGIFVVMTLANAGCTAFLAPRTTIPVTAAEPSPDSMVPRELDMVSLPPYVIEPPDILMINAVKVVPKPPHKVEPFDGLLIRALGVIDEAPIGDIYFVEPEGDVNLGPNYGKVSVVGLTIDEAQDMIRRHLAREFNEPVVTVSLAVSAGAQQIFGEHLVGPDGSVNLGTYGTVYVSGLTVADAKARIEEQLSNYLLDPEVVVDVFAYNSKKYYVITQGGGFGDNIVTQPIVGNETVLDALAAIGGISQVSSSKIWIARPTPNGVGCDQILPVNYEEMTRGASTTTNYQLMPGDRLFIAEDPLVRFDAVVSKVTKPFERIFGFVSLGTATLNRIERFGLGSLQ